MQRRILVSAVLSVLLLVALAANVNAAEVKITASDGAAHNFFGASVAISGDYAVVGAWGDGLASGSAYIFKRDGTAWTEQAKITASDYAANDWFGRSVALSGDYAVVGAVADTGSYSGSAYIYDIPIEIIDPSAAITHAEYDIVASVPELATVVVLTLIGLLALAGYVRYARRKN